MQRDKNIAYDQGVIEEKNKIVKAFIDNVGQLVSASKHVGLGTDKIIESHFEQHIQFKKQLEALREQPGLLTGDDVNQIANAYNSLVSTTSLKKSSAVSYDDFTQWEKEFTAWKNYAAELSLPELVKTLPEKLMLMNLRDEGKQAPSNKNEEDDDATIFAKVNRVIKGYEAGKVTQEDIVPLINALLDTYKKIMDIMADPEFKPGRDIASQRRSIETILERLRKLKLISGQDALKIGMAYEFQKSILTFETEKEKAKEQSEMWKSYAAGVGNQFAKAEEKKIEDKRIISAAWKKFLQDTSPKEKQTFLFQADDRERAIELQRKLDALAGDSSSIATKPMLQLIAAFYLQQCETRKPNDMLLQKMSELIVDILIKFSLKNENIRAILREEAVIANKGIEPDDLKKTLKSPNIMKGVLVALDLTSLEKPELDRKSTFGPHFKTEL